jgi:hypothetical protein
VEEVAGCGRERVEALESGSSPIHIVDLSREAIRAARSFARCGTSVQIHR